jgi:hypothetical protein
MIEERRAQMVGKETIKLINLGHSLDMERIRGLDLYEIKLYNDIKELELSACGASIQEALDGLERRVKSLIKDKLDELRQRQRELEE